MRRIDYVRDEYIMYDMNRLFMK